jgi:thymidylate synthase
MNLMTRGSLVPMRALQVAVHADQEPPASLNLICETLVNYNTEEQAYLDLFSLLFRSGHQKTDRTGVGTISYFSPPNLEFSLRGNNIPILTTKNVAMKTGVIPELLWFISGSTDTTELERQNCHIWRGNTSREALDKRGLQTYSVGELGPGYGFQWRHSGEQYHGISDQYEGVDQLGDLVHSLKTDPDSRRMLMVSWSPAHTSQMALPPCHVLYQVYTYVVDGERFLSAKMYQRSADSFLGVPFNIASYSLLTHMLAHLTGYTADRIVFTYGDYHIYNNHIEQVKEQLTREPRPFPKIHFARQVGDINDFTPDDICITGYNPHPKIPAPMAV